MTLTSTLTFGLVLLASALLHPLPSVQAKENVDTDSEVTKSKEIKKKKESKMKDYKKPTQSELKKMLTPKQYSVTQEEGTESPFNNEYWNNKEQGIYVDVVSGEPLFSSKQKYDSGTGWPSFSELLEPDNIQVKTDKRLGMERKEVRSKYGDSHLGHVFDDGPGPSGLRYCMNSASLRFIPVSKLEESGYGKYLPLFQNATQADQKKSKSSLDDKNKVAQKQTAIFSGGCFWGVEELIRKLPGVIETSVGYTGGFTSNPKYTDVKKGDTGHAESVRIVFDPTKTSYEDILTYFFKLHDPTTTNQQGNDKGTQYRSAIFYLNDDQKKTAEKVKAKVEKSGAWHGKVVTEIVHATEFYPAEDYHQKYLEKHPDGYTCHYVRNLDFK